MKLFSTDIKQLNKICGIYLIIVNNKEYVGSSINIYNRLKHHRSALKNGKHHNSTLKNLYNKYNNDEFNCYLITSCAANRLEYLENYYIKLIKPYINHILDTKRQIRDKVYRNNLSIAGKKRFLNFDPINSKVIYQYDLIGNFIKEYKSASFASRALNLKDPSALCTAARLNTCSHGFSWSYNKYDILRIREKKYKLQKIIQLDLNNNFIKEWNSITEASNTLKIRNITRSILNNRTSGGFKWKYK